MGDIRGVNESILSALLITNALSSVTDTINANPWWSTNSAFALTAYNYSRVYPNEQPDFSGTFSFPQFLSKWSSSLTAPAASAGPASASAISKNWFTRYFGFVRRDSYDQANPYTWFDWVADAMRSNMIANSAINTNELTQWATQSGADYVEEFDSDTNKLAIGRSITNQLDDALSEIDYSSSGVQSSAYHLLSGIHVDRVLPESYTGGNPMIEIFPESTIGGVHVGAVRGTLVLPNGVAYWVNTVARFIWSVIFLVWLSV